MLDLLFLIPALPFAGFLVLALSGRRLSRSVVAVIGSGSVGLSALIATGSAVQFLLSPPGGHRFVQTLGTWLTVGKVPVTAGLALDPLSLVMTLVITIVGFLIHLYSTEFMQDDEGYSRFFAYLNLFVGAMLTLVLADNLLILYLGWEGVGLCSYLLIGFWYRDPANGRAARKAFITTRVGDTALAIGLFLLVANLGTLQISSVLELAPLRFPVGSGLAIVAAALLLGGAVGKSAQLPLQVWLPDAMAGPTPVSALIHAATMVTAGVYLIARMHALFLLAPEVLSTVAVIGAVTLLLSGFSALAQHDLKRVLAYSTISQIGYMFLALGVGAWTAAMFHFLTHAFFKALLFLGAGVVIKALDDEHDMRRMGGLRHELPVVFWTFLIGSASLSALPYVTAGFYSKDLILSRAWALTAGGKCLAAAGLAGALLTSIYTFRMVFLTFFGEAHTSISARPGGRMLVPLIVLAVLSVVGGFIELPSYMGHVTLFSGLLRTVFPAADAGPPEGQELMVQFIGSAACLAGIFFAYLIYLPRPGGAENRADWPGGMLHHLWAAGWGFDRLYNMLFVAPFVWLSQANRRDVIDDIYTGISQISGWLHRRLSLTENGRVRWYAAGIAVGAAIVLGIVLLS